MFSIQAAFYTVKQGPYSAVINASTDEGGKFHEENIKRAEGKLIILIAYQAHSLSLHAQFSLPRSRDGVRQVCTIPLLLSILMK